MKRAWRGIETGIKNGMWSEPNWTIIRKYWQLSVLDWIAIKIGKECKIRLPQLEKLNFVLVWEVEFTTSPVGEVEFLTSPVGEVEFPTSPVGDVEFPTSPVGDVHFSKLGSWQCMYEYRRNTELKSVCKNVKEICGLLILFIVEMWLEESNNL